MRISDWSSDVCSSDLPAVRVGIGGHYGEVFVGVLGRNGQLEFTVIGDAVNMAERIERVTRETGCDFLVSEPLLRSEEHTSELQSLMRISYAVFCLKKKKRRTQFK